jgi:PIN domain nuclease of toxin-antitoxin system
MASAWEMSIKSQLDKLKLPVSWDVMLKRQQADNGLALLPVELKHITRKQPHHHKDPFDRMLISQSQVEDMPLVSRDSQFKHYDIELIW